MPTSKRDTDLNELVDGDDLEFLKSLAAKRGIAVAELVKEAIQDEFEEQTRPRPMKGVVQAFRRKK